MIPKDLTPAILEGDVGVVLGRLPDESIQCVVTSPPYWGLRDYGLPSILWGGDSSCRHSWAMLPPRRKRSPADVRNPDSLQAGHPGANIELRSDGGMSSGAVVGSVSWALSRPLSSTSTTSPRSSTRSGECSGATGRSGSILGTPSTRTAPSAAHRPRRSPPSGTFPRPAAEVRRGEALPATASSSRRTWREYLGGSRSNSNGGGGGSVPTACGRSETRCRSRSWIARPAPTSTSSSSRNRSGTSTTARPSVSQSPAGPIPREAGSPRS